MITQTKGMLPFMHALQFTARIPVFDANVRVGDLYDEPAPCRDRAGLLAEMDRHGVERALIYHAQAEVLSPIEGNLYRNYSGCVKLDRHLPHQDGPFIV
jgi:hypothetical protein